MKESKIPQECPRWQTCSVNNCPLDPRYPGLNTVKGDPEVKCPVKKSIRIRIGSLHPELRYGGHTLAEYSAKLRYDQLPALKKEKFHAVAMQKIKEINANKGAKTP